MKIPNINLATSFFSVPRGSPQQLANLLDGRVNTVGLTPSGTMPYVLLDMGNITGRVWGVRLTAVGSQADLSPSHGLSVFLSDSLGVPTQVLCRRDITFLQASESVDVACPLQSRPMRYVIVQKVGLGPLVLGLAEVTPLIQGKKCLRGAHA